MQALRELIRELILLEFSTTANIQGYAAPLGAPAAAPLIIPEPFAVITEPKQTRKKKKRKKQNESRPRRNQKEDRST